MQKNIIESIKKYENTISFHTPGHSGLPLEPFFSNSKYDVTELTYTDNLLSPTGVIAELENKFAQAYNVDHTLLVTSGATTAIMMAIYITRNLGSFMIVNSAHKSVFNALRVNNCQTIIATESDVINVLENIKIGAIIITTPDYYGDVYDATFYKDLAKKYNCILIIDSAHGSHFAFSDILPRCASLDGDIVVHSAHKTLPTLTGGAMLNVCEKFYKSALMARNIFHTTSPSYLTLASLDYSLDYMLKNGQEDYKAIYKKIQLLDSILLKTPFDLLTTPSRDFSRVVISSPYNGEYISNILENNGIIIEMSETNKIVLIVTPFNYKELEKVGEILTSLDFSTLPKADYKAVVHLPYKNIWLKWHQDFEYIEIAKSLNKISFTEVGLFPPSTPLVYSGQIISQEVIDILLANLNCTFGVLNGCIAVSL